MINTEVMTAEQTNPFRLKHSHSQASRSLSRESRGLFTHMAGISRQGREEQEGEKTTFFNSSFQCLIPIPVTGLLTNMNHHISETVAAPVRTHKPAQFYRANQMLTFHVLINSLVWKNIHLINNYFLFLPPWWLAKGKCFC